jgi:tetratricopeptide (TPR) repeat protein
MQSFSRLGALTLALALLPAPRIGAEPSSETRIREIPLTLVVDADYQKISSWRGVAHGIVQNATEDLGETVGLTFSIEEEVVWNPPEGITSLEEMLDAAVTRVGPRPGIIVVFLGRWPEEVADQEQRAYGYLGRGGLIILAHDYHQTQFGASFKKNRAMLLRHELGHVFGIPHLTGTSIMSPVPSHREVRFGELELDILRANRTMDFAARTPFTGCDLETLRDVYILLDDRGEMEPSLLTNLAVACYQERRYMDARILFERSLRRDRHSITALAGMAQTVVALGDTSTARRITEQLMEVEPLTPELEGTIGGLWLKFGQNELAEAFLSDAIDAGVERFSIFFNRGLARFRQERHDEAKTDFEHALTIQERSEAWFNLGLVCDALENREEATRAFTRYLDLVPEGRKSQEARDFLERQ